MRKDKRKRNTQYKPNESTPQSAELRSFPICGSRASLGKASKEDTVIAQAATCVPRHNVPLPTLASSWTSYLGMWLYLWARRSSITTSCIFFNPVDTLSYIYLLRFSPTLRSLLKIESLERKSIAALEEWAVLGMAVCVMCSAIIQGRVWLSLRWHSLSRNFVCKLKNQFLIQASLEVSYSQDWLD